eukprot:SAG11_NODE_141_length_14934_cov_4.821503_5_plen_79_part_00
MFVMACRGRLVAEVVRVNTHICCFGLFRYNVSRVTVSLLRSFSSNGREPHRGGGGGLNPTVSIRALACSNAEYGCYEL